MDFKRRASIYGQSVIKFLKFCGEHSAATGLFALIGVGVSVIPLFKDMNESVAPKVQQPQNQSVPNYSPTYPMNNVNNNLSSAKGCDSTLSNNDGNISRMLKNSDKDCDYFVPEGTMIAFSSKVEIEPGTKFKMGKDSKITFRDGELIAEGTLENPIIFESEKAIKGFWKGLKLSNLRKAKLNHLKIKYAGNTQSDKYSLRDGWQSALTIESGKISIQNVHVSGSYVNGAAIHKETDIELFKNNKFFANELAGLVTDSKIVPNLDRDSDYYGEGSPNGIPAVNLNDVSINSDIEEVIWPAINSPYLVKGIYVSNHGGSQPRLVLEPGVRIAITKRGRIFSLGELIAKGTKEKPIIFERSPNDKEHWSSIYSGGNMVFENVILDGGGNKKGEKHGRRDVNRGALIATDYSSKRNKLVFKNILIKNSETWGIGCDSNNEALKVIQSSFYTFKYKDNKEGDVNPRCPI